MNRLTTDCQLQLDITTEIPRSGPEVFIKRLKAREECTFGILSDRLFGIWVHWNGAKSEPHFKSEKNCPGCLSRRPKRFKGYIHCWWFENSQEVFLELTPKSAQSLEDQLGKTQSWRGNRINVKRGRGDNGRLIVAVLTAIPASEVQTPARDPLPSILALWGFDEGHPFGGKELPTRVPSRNGSH